MITTDQKGITCDKFVLENGLRVLVHHDNTTPIVAVNLLFDVGARDESPDKTGFAHLFEHLMFGGSKNIPDFDGPLQMAGGQSNAFTSNDITNYYCTLPKQNLETAFWLEADRLNELAFTDKSLEVQRNVVIEEFKQRYLNQPYGDVWLLLRPMVYQVHPYNWATIGKEVAHIEHATMEDVKSFFYKHYSPANCILCVAGDVSVEQIQILTEKWFGSIPKREPYVRNLPIEPLQTSRRFMEVERNVPSDALYMAFNMGVRNSNDYYVVDVISDVLSRGKSSRFYKQLLIENAVFSEISAYVTGSFDNGLLIISGKPADGITLEEAESAVWFEIKKFLSEGVTAHELEKVLNKIESTHVYGEMSVLTKAMNLCYFELLGDASEANNELMKYRNIDANDVKERAGTLFLESNCSVLYYRAKS